MKTYGLAALNATDFSKRDYDVRLCMCSAGIVALVYFSGALDADSQLKRDSPAFESNVRSGFLGAVAVFLGKRPHRCKNPVPIEASLGSALTERMRTLQLMENFVKRLVPPIISSLKVDLTVAFGKRQPQLQCIDL